MTTATLFSNIGYPQNGGGSMNPANAVVNTGAGGIIAESFTLTVVPSTGWAQAAVMVSNDNANFVTIPGVHVAPNSGGTVTVGPTNVGDNPQAFQYYQAELMAVSPGGVATLTMTY